MRAKKRIILATTVPQSLMFVEGMISDLQLKFDVVLLSSPGSEWEGLKNLHPGLKCLEIAMERHMSPLKDLKSLWQVWKAFRQEKPAMVHSMTPKAGLLCMLAAWFAGVPCRVHTFTGLVFPTSTGLKKRILMATDWITCLCATHVIPEGEGVKLDLLNNRITKKNIQVLGHGNVKGIDLDRFRRTENVMAEARELKNDDLFTFISVGRLVGDKGINELVTAFKRLNQEIPATRLVLVGGYEERLDPLKSETLNEINNHSGIVAVGSIRDIRPWLVAADCAILASYREGFPNVVIEAGAMGLPQIVTDINGANEIIIKGKNGMIIPPRDADRLYLAMKEMMENPSARNAMAANAREMIASRYEQSYVRKCLYDFYGRILTE